MYKSEAMREREREIERIVTVPVRLNSPRTLLWLISRCVCVCTVHFTIVLRCISHCMARHFPNIELGVVYLRNIPLLFHSYQLNLLFTDKQWKENNLRILYEHNATK